MQRLQSTGADGNMPALTVHCPFCGKPLKVLDTIPTVRNGEGTSHASICRCGVFDIVVRYNKVVGIRLRDPGRHPDFLPQSR